MELDWNFNAVDFETNIENIAAQGTEEITTYQKPAFDDFKANTLVLVYIIVCTRLKHITFTFTKSMKFLGY